jgi:hypothetical protein
MVSLMNNPAYATRDPRKIGPKVEGVWRMELAASGPISFSKDPLKKCNAFGMTEGGLAGLMEAAR